jgi:hypothetical protein
MITAFGRSPRQRGGQGMLSSANDGFTNWSGHGDRCWAGCWTPIDLGSPRIESTWA